VDRNTKLRTVFEFESRGEVEKRKEEAIQPLNLKFRKEPWHLAYLLEAEPLEFPKRPQYSAGETRTDLEKRESSSFKDWHRELIAKHSERLNYYEKNIEVWRQLWRVLEKSDLLLLVVDARYPLFHFPVSLYKYIIEDLKKPLLLVLNKKDLVSREIIDQWKIYLEHKYEGITVISFSSFQSPTSDENNEEKKRRIKQLRGHSKYSQAEGVEQFLQALRNLCIRKHGDIVTIPPITLDKDSNCFKEAEDNELAADSASKNSKIIVVGTIGHPNVGKSSLINGLMGRKVVSTSRTPGHTKHFQTLFLTPHVVLCDCPGLVFPALDRPKPLQILCGLYPLAQIREPYSAIRWLAEIVPLERVYKLKLPEDYTEWSPLAICEAYALQKQYFTHKAARPDTHRAGRELLIQCLDGRVVVNCPPPLPEVIEAYKNKYKNNDDDDFVGSETELSESDIVSTVKDEPEKDSEEEEQTSGKSIKKKSSSGNLSG